MFIEWLISWVLLFPRMLSIFLAALLPWIGQRYVLCVREWRTTKEGKWKSTFQSQHKFQFSHCKQHCRWKNTFVTTCEMSRFTNRNRFCFRSCCCGYDVDGTWKHVCFDQREITWRRLTNNVWSQRVLSRNATPMCSFSRASGATETRPCSHIEDKYQLISICHTSCDVL